jgi:DNA invertase Pin-like site-specific DNA recombinase
MSTDLQKYSTENQLHTIRRYAEQRGFTIVRVFEDSGRSGLRMDGRDGLQSLMLEVQSGAAGFQAILVYDAKRDASPQEEAVIRCVSSGFFVLLAFQLVRVPVAQL